MKITLRTMLEENKKEELSILQLKRELIDVKKSGEIFYNANVLTLGLDDEFDLYFYLQPSLKSVKNAFPIPIAEFTYLPKNEEEYKKALEHYFYFYYEKNASAKHFERFDYKTYFAEEFVWFYYE